MRIYDKPRFFAWTDYETTGLSGVDVPIEIAIVVTNELMEEQARFESLIKMNHPDQFMQGGDWKKQYQGAFAAHGISAMEVLAAPLARQVAQDLYEFLRQYGSLTSRKRPIMVSDNPRFEDLMNTAFRVESGVNVPNLFHYNIWSPIMLTAAVGLGRPVKPHRAMGDVDGMIEHVRKAFAILDSVGIPTGEVPVPEFSRNGGKDWAPVEPVDFNDTMFEGLNRELGGLTPEKVAELTEAIDDDVKAEIGEGIVEPPSEKPAPLEPVFRKDSDISKPKRKKPARKPAKKS